MTRVRLITFIGFLFLFNISVASAGILIGGTRVIYNGDKKESALSVSNPDNFPYLIQSWVESEKEAAPFIITPPLFRLDGEQENILRIVYTGSGLPEDRESLYWINIKSIPRTEKKTDANTLQIAVKTRIKLIYRPQVITQLTPEMDTHKLQWSLSGNQLVVYNPTPFYMHFYSISADGNPLKDISYVSPGSSATFRIPARKLRKISWQLINDYGGTGPEHNVTLSP
ncbi:molecular chaperone [Morganella morganii]